MKTRKDEDWLDRELRHAIDTGRPEFDAGAWKRRYPEAYDAVTSRARETLGVGIGNRRRHWFVGTLAAVAVIVIAVGVFFTRTPPQGGRERGVGTSAKTTSPANVVSMMALRSAYRQGGETALNQQLDKALETLGPRPGALLKLQDLLDRNG